MLARRLKANLVDLIDHYPAVALLGPRHAGKTTLAVALATRHPDHREQLLAFATHQAAAHAHIDQHLLDAVWVLRRSDV